MAIITQPTARQRLEREYRVLYMHPFKTDDEIRLYYEIQLTFLHVARIRDQRRPVCDHGLPNCPGCHHEQPYNPRLDIEAPAVQ